MAKRSCDPKKVVKQLQSHVNRLTVKRFDKTTGEFARAEEVRIKKAIKALDDNWKELREFVHNWNFGKPK